MRPSWTAQAAVAQRAVLTDRGLLNDSYARGMLTPGMSATSRFFGRAPRRVFRRAVTLAGAAGSARWFDAALVSALDAGIRQVAIVGAGYDSRAWRFARDGVRFFELDHGGTQEAKIHAAPGPGPTYVTADLREESAADALREGGLNLSEPSVVVIEAVSMYLTDAVVRRQLAALAQSMAPGTRLLINFFPSSPPSTAQTKRQLRLQRMARIRNGEHFTFGADPDEAARLIKEAGWTLREQLSFREAARTLVPRSAGLPVEAIDERKILIAAEI